MNKRKNFLRNIILILIMFVSTNCVYADSYIMVAPSNITKVECGNKNILSINILSTLLNEKKSIIVTSLSDGQTSFTLYMKRKKCDYKASVCNGKLTIEGDRAIKILPVDLPPEFESEAVK